MLSIKNDTKINEGRGKGSGASYLPWIQTREISSVGTCSNPKDWKTGRTVELLSQGIGNRVVGMQSSKIVDFDIQEALAMKKPFEEELYHIAGEIAF